MILVSLTPSRSRVDFNMFPSSSVRIGTLKVWSVISNLIAFGVYLCLIHTNVSVPLAFHVISMAVNFCIVFLRSVGGALAVIRLRSPSFVSI
jgi:hypothetical protein